MIRAAPHADYSDYSRAILLDVHASQTERGRGHRRRGHGRRVPRGPCPVSRQERRVLDDRVAPLALDR